MSRNAVLRDSCEQKMNDLRSALISKGPKGLTGKKTETLIAAANNAAQAIEKILKSPHLKETELEELSSLLSDIAVVISPNKTPKSRQESIERIEEASHKLSEDKTSPLGILKGVLLTIAVTACVLLAVALDPGAATDLLPSGPSSPSLGEALQQLTDEAEEQGPTLK